MKVGRAYYAGPLAELIPTLKKATPMFSPHSHPRFSQAQQARRRARQLNHLENLALLLVLALSTWILSSCTP